MSQASTETSSQVRKPPRTKVGVVISDKRDKTRTVAVDYQTRHRKYGKYILRQAKFHVHDPQNASKIGDRVEIASCRPISKHKSWRLTRVLVEAPAPVEHKADVLDEQPAEVQAAGE